MERAANRVRPFQYDRSIVFTKAEASAVEKVRHEMRHEESRTRLNAFQFLPAVALLGRRLHLLPLSPRHSRRHECVLHVCLCVCVCVCVVMHGRVLLGAGSARAPLAATEGDRGPAPRRAAALAGLRHAPAPTRRHRCEARIQAAGSTTADADVGAIAAAAAQACVVLCTVASTDSEAATSAKIPAHSPCAATRRTIIPTQPALVVRCISPAAHGGATHGRRDS